MNHILFSVAEASEVQNLDKFIGRVLTGYSVNVEDGELRVLLTFNAEEDAKALLRKPERKFSCGSVKTEE